MKNLKSILTACTLLMALTISSMGCSRADTPENLLRNIRDLAADEKYGDLHDLVYPYSNFPAAALEGIREQDPDHRGDWAYSDEALGVILDKHLDKLKPATEEQLNEFFLRKRRKNWSNDPTLVALAENSPQAKPSPQAIT